jgi:hypothetical protein
MYMLNNKRRYKKKQRLEYQRGYTFFCITGYTKNEFLISHKTGGPPALGNWGAKQEL